MITMFGCVYNEPARQTQKLDDTDGYRCLLIKDSETNEKLIVIGYYIKIEDPYRLKGFININYKDKNHTFLADIIQRKWIPHESHQHIYHVIYVLELQDIEFTKLITHDGDLSLTLDYKNIKFTNNHIKEIKDYYIYY